MRDVVLSLLFLFPPVWSVSHFTVGWCRVILGGMVFFLAWSLTTPCTVLNLTVTLSFLCAFSMRLSLDTPCCCAPLFRLASLPCAVLVCCIGGGSCVAVVVVEWCFCVCPWVLSTHNKCLCLWRIFHAVFCACFSGVLFACAEFESRWQRGGVGVFASVCGLRSWTSCPLSLSL